MNYRGRVGESKITGNLKGTLKTGFSMIGIIIKYRFSAVDRERFEHGRARSRRVSVARWLPWAVVSLAAIVPYLPTLDDYFVRDDFGVVQLLAQKPASYFPRWFAAPWMDHIWGYTPDEIRPFPALSYQLTALGGPVSPVLHHVLNIAACTRSTACWSWRSRGAPRPQPRRRGVRRARLRAAAGTHRERRLDHRPRGLDAGVLLSGDRSSPTWRLRQRAAARALYVGVARALLRRALHQAEHDHDGGDARAYDVLVAAAADPADRQRSCCPYVPFALMTAGYLWLRYLLFGQVAREGALNARALHDFRHPARPSPPARRRRQPRRACGASSGWRWRLIVRRLARCCAARRPAQSVTSSATALLRARLVGDRRRCRSRSPAITRRGTCISRRSAGRSCSASVYDAAWRHRASTTWQRGSRDRCRSSSLSVYGVRLARSVREWNRHRRRFAPGRARRARTARWRAPEGSLIVIGAPGRSWEWALPFAVRPPFSGPTWTRVFIISPRALSCCTAPWFEETRQAMQVVRRRQPRLRHSAAVGSGHRRAVARRPDAMCRSCRP